MDFENVEEGWQRGLGKYLYRSVKMLLKIIRKRRHNRVHRQDMKQNAEEER